MPAGRLMNVLTTGSRRETNTAVSPWRSNQTSARSSSCLRRNTKRPQRSISGLPPRQPTPQAIQEPTRLPRVPARPTATKLRCRPSWPRLATNSALASAPPNSMVTSLGIGTQADSSSISTKMASRPYSRMMSVISSATACSWSYPPVRGGSSSRPGNCIRLSAPMGLAEEVGGGQALGVLLGRGAVARPLDRHRDRPGRVQGQLVRPLRALQLGQLLDEGDDGVADRGLDPGPAEHPQQVVVLVLEP